MLGADLAGPALSMTVQPNPRRDIIYSPEAVDDAANPLVLPGVQGGAYDEPGRPAPEGRTGCERVRAMTDEEVVAAALSDPDAQPLTPDQLPRMRRLPDVKALRARLAMTQEQFATTYCLPLGTVRVWQQGRTLPDAPALVLLAVIDREPELVRRALQ